MLNKEDADYQGQQLIAYRNNLKHLLSQAAIWGGEALAPINVVNQIREQRFNIQYIKSVLRSNGVDVEDHPYDFSFVSPKVIEQSLKKHNVIRTEFVHELVETIISNRLSLTEIFILTRDLATRNNIPSLTHFCLFELQGYEVIDVSEYNNFKYRMTTISFPRDLLAVNNPAGKTPTEALMSFVRSFKEDAATNVFVSNSIYEMELRSQNLSGSWYVTFPITVFNNLFGLSEEITLEASIDSYMYQEILEKIKSKLVSLLVALMRSTSLL